MSIEQILTILVVGLFSIVQSIFGIGLLVFGTPTLLLMGYGYLEVLGILAPASFVISIVQVGTNFKRVKNVSAALYWLCLPFIGFGLWISQINTISHFLNILVGSVLGISAILRVSPITNSKMPGFVIRHSTPYHLLMGLVHGLTNLGGSLLIILASCLSSSKEQIRFTVAYYYLLFSTVQMALLVGMLGQLEVILSNLYLAVISVSIYFLIGNRIFVRASEPKFDKALSVLMAVYAILIIFNLQFQSFSQG